MTGSQNLSFVPVIPVNAGGILNHINEFFIFFYIKIYSSCTLNQYMTLLIHTDFLKNIGLLRYANITNVETFDAIMKKKSH